MDEVIKSPPSPLVRGKPAWHVRYTRVFLIYMLGNILFLGGQYVLILVLDLGTFILIAYSMVMLVYLAGVWWWVARWLKGQGLSVWRLRWLLETIDGVPCPNCLYPLCQLDDADTVHVCPECGCGIRGADAIRAWESLRGYVIPESWGEAWEQRLDGIGD